MLFPPHGSRPEIEDEDLTMHNASITLKILLCQPKFQGTGQPSTEFSVLGNGNSYGAASRTGNSAVRRQLVGAAVYCIE
jgi:hypothetical protein